MKIVCDNCATKYSIADEKVRGKVFKIRCKKCSHIIVVRGGDGAGAPMDAKDANSDAGFPGDDGATLAARGSGAPAPLGASDAVWHLVVDREQIGPLSPAEVRAKFAAGEVDVETYAWREGFADWLRLGSIDDFRDLAAAAPPQAEEGATRRTDSADLFASSSAADEPDSGGGADLFGGQAPAPEPAPAAAAPEPFAASGGANLFGAPDEAPAPAPAMAARPSRNSSPGFSTGQQAAMGSNGGGAAAQAAASADSRMTGQRNENSVLFSLNNLQALASGGGGAPAPKPGVDTRPGFANSQTEGSGLIDIRAMAASTLAAGPATGGPSAKSGDEPVNFAAAPIFSPMAAPILMPAAPTGAPKWMWAILGVGVLAVVGIVVVGILLLTRKSEPPVVAMVPAGTQPVAAAPAGTQPVAAAPAGTQPVAAAPSAPTGDAPKVAATADEHGKKAHAPKAEKGTKPDKAAKPGKTEVASAAAPPAQEAAPTKPSKRKGGDALDDLLNSASPDKPAAAPRRAAAAEPASSGGGDDSNLPDQLGKGEIVTGMSKIKARVAGCYDQYKVPGLANVSVTIAKSGHVSNASVTGSFAGTPTGACVEKAVKSASFAQFKGSPQTINYPFMLR